MKPLDKGVKRELICMVGLPRSGKSTIAHKLGGTINAPIVERDAIRMALHGQPYLAELEPLVKVFDDTFIRTLFYTGYRQVIVDETNFSLEARKRRLSDLWETSFYLVDTSTEECIKRAVLSGQQYLIPVIEEMSNRWESLGPGEKRFVADKA